MKYDEHHHYYALFAALFASSPAHEASMDVGMGTHRVFFKAKSIVLFDRVRGAILGNAYDYDKLFEQSME
jgi:hypothetical protein